MAGEWLENVIHSLLKDLIVISSLQLNDTSTIQCRLDESVAAPASTVHHAIVAFKEKALSQTRPLTFSS